MAAHALIIFGCTLGLLAPDNEFGWPDEWVSFTSVFFGCFGAPFFGAFGAAVFISLKRRSCLKPGHCSYCGWKTRSTLLRCWVCGTPYTGFCSCGYNLTGLTEPRCPECGTTFEHDRKGE